MIDGLAVIDKPPGMTSHDVVAHCRRLFGQRRVGHAGTLDPDATGVLLVGLGRATRLMRFMSGLPKSYDAEVVLGVATSTLDAAGEVIGEWDMSAVSLEQVRSAAATLTGEILQVPPMVSAVKVGGRRLHQLAREGLEVERTPRKVTVRKFKVHRLDSNGPSPSLVVSVECSSGTYVRVLAADLGVALGGGAHVSKLRRSAVGPWTLKDAVALDALDRDALVPLRRCLPWIDSLEVGRALASQVANGRVLERSAVSGLAGDGPWALVDPAGELLAVYGPHEGSTVKPLVVLAGAAGGAR